MRPSQVRGRVFASDFAAVTLANAIGSGAAGWLLDRSGFGVSGLLVGMSAITLAFGGLWWVWITLGAPAKTDAAAARAATSG